MTKDVIKLKVLQSINSILESKGKDINNYSLVDMPLICIKSIKSPKNSTIN